MNKVLLDIFSTQISDERGSKKSKKIIFSHNVFSLKKINFLSQIFFAASSSLSKLTYINFFISRWAFFTFNFYLMSWRNLKGSLIELSLDAFSQFELFVAKVDGRNDVRVLDLGLLNFQK